DDHWIDYKYGAGTGGVVYIVAPGKGYSLQYCSLCATKACTTCTDGWKTLRDNITSFVPGKPTVSASDKALKDNFVAVDLKACFDANKKTVKANCGTLDNPNINMRTRIKLPGVSIQ
ncbi:MAG TPA: hypothetical protein VI976_01850, partial [Candidatus Omnitrophota bacterium]|nr:hypothetical protein [Candidatus Omnitrophota bacterium]